MTTNKTRLVGFRLSEAEYNKIVGAFSATTCPKLSDYLRMVLLNKPVVSTYRNRSMDDLIMEMVTLRKELGLLANNFNQVVRRLHTFSNSEIIIAISESYETDKKKLLAQIDNIHLLIEKAAAIW